MTDATDPKRADFPHPSPERQWIATLITRSCSEKAAQRFLDFTVAPMHLDQVGDVGRKILQLCHRPVPGACVMMSAMWVAGIEHDHPDLPVYEVAGDLLVDGQSVFWTESAPEQVAADFERSRLDWDGHCWIVVGDYVGDVSIFRTAYSTQSSPRLSRAIVERFGTGKGLLLSTVANLEAMGFEYRPKYVVTRAQVNSLLLGACDFFE